MIHVTYDEHCAYKPRELGLQIAMLLTNGKIPKSFRFVGYEDKVVSDGKTVDDSKHACALLFIDDIEGKETGLKNMSDLAALLVSDEKMNSECSEKEGIASLFDDVCKDLKITGDDADKRIRVMFLDSAEFKTRQAESAKAMADCDRFWYDETQRCYCCISRINENGLRQFKENGLDYTEVFKNEETRHAREFVKKHWPDRWAGMRITTGVLDMCRKVYDEQDKVNRHIWKFCFRLFDETGSEIAGDYAQSKIRMPAIEGAATEKDIAGVLEYYVAAGALSETDAVVLVMPEKRDILVVRDCEETADVMSIFGNAGVRDVIDLFAESGRTATDTAFVKEFEKIFDENKDRFVGKITSLGFAPSAIFED